MKPSQTCRFCRITLAVALALGGWLAMSVQAEDERVSAQTRAATPSRTSKSKAAPAATTQEADADRQMKRIEAKLDQLLEHQQKIFSRFDDVMEELRIVKIRASVR